MAAEQYSWDSLCFEIQQMILEKLIQDEPIFYQYALVCRRWQTIVNFYRLTVLSSQMTNLDTIDRYHRMSIKELKFHILLQDYGCDQCCVPESPPEAYNNNNIIQEAIRSLFKALSTWETRSVGLNLDISVFSPSDSRHHFRGRISGRSSNQNQREDRLDDPFHGWINGQRIVAPPKTAFSRVYGWLNTDPMFWQHVPQAKVVTSLSLRRRTHRRWTHQALEGLWNCLPMLQNINHEPMGEYFPDEHALLDYGKLTLENIRLSRTNISFHSFSQRAQVLTA